MPISTPILKFPSRADTPESVRGRAEQTWRIEAATIARLAASGSDVVACLMPDGGLALVLAHDGQSSAARGSARPSS